MVFAGKGDIAAGTAESRCARLAVDSRYP